MSGTLRFHTVVLSTLIVAALAAAACGGGGDGGSPEQQPTVTAHATTPEATATSPVATAVATPAEGAYRLGEALPAATFDRMLGFAAIPGSADEAVIVTQGGVIHRVPLSGSGPTTVYGDVSGRLISSPGNEEGLLGLAFSPEFGSDGRVYLYYTAGEPRRSVLSRFQVVGDAIDVGSETVILEAPQPYANHNGGQIAFGPDGYLYVALGDGGSAGDPQGNGQNLSTLLGSILRLDVSGEGYAVPPSNPFVDTPGARPEIYAYGLRNPWRFSFDRATGDLWAGDVGQNRWEEVDRIAAGGNYGWNVIEGFECYESSDCDRAGLEAPRAAYGHDEGCSVTGGYVYRGPSMPELNGWYVYGDYCSGRIWAVNTADDSAPVLLADTGLSIASFGELPDGELLALTFENAVYRLQRES
jgi:glucose/arabinose dehydrogenase